MIIHDFTYERPSCIDEALSLLATHGPDARPIAGGTDVVVNMKYRSVLQLFDGAGSPKAKFKAASRVAAIDRPKVLISLSRLDELDGIAVEEDKIVIGPRTTMSKIVSSDCFARNKTAIADAAQIMGSPLIRNRATIGGNLVNARPAADTAVAAIADGAVLRLRSISGERNVEASAFITAPGKTVKKPDELLVAIEVPTSPNTGSAYVRHGSRKQLEIPIVCVAAWLQLDQKTGSVSKARICLGAVGPTPLLALSAAKALVGEKPTVNNFAAAAKVAKSEAKPIDDFRGSASYRLDLVDTLAFRALKAAFARAKGSEVSQ